MNKNLKFVLLMLLFVLLFNVKINNVEANSKISCYSYTTESDCKGDYPKCNWINGRCYEQNVASEPCNDNNIRKVLKIFGYVLLIAKFIIPFLIIAFGTFDLYKSVIDKDEKSIYKQVKVLGVRIVAGVIVFFIPNLVYAAFSLSDKLNIINTEEYNTCATCIFDPLEDTVCSVSK